MNNMKYQQCYGETKRKYKQSYQILRGFRIMEIERKILPQIYAQREMKT